MEYLKLQCLIFACLALNHAFAQQSAYRQESQKVQLEDIEQDNLKSAQQTTNQASSAAQYTPYPSQAPQIVYNVQPQQSQQATPVQTTNQQQSTYPLYTLPAQTAGALPGQQHYIYYTQAPQQLSPYELPFFPGSYPFVPQAAQPVLPANVNVNDYYKALQVQPQAAATSAKNPQAVKAAVPQVPANYYFSPIPQSFYTPVNVPQLTNPAQYLAYNSFYPTQTAQKSVYSAGVKSTTQPSPTKNSEANYRFEYTSPDFAKLRVTG